MLSVVVVTFAALDGEMSTKGLDESTRAVMGDTKGAFVALGSAMRLTAAALGFSMPSAAKRTAALESLGGGVTGPVDDGRDWARFLVGVDTPPTSFSPSAPLFRPRGFAAGGTRGTGGLSSVWERSRADRRVAML